MATAQKRNSLALQQALQQVLVTRRELELLQRVSAMALNALLVQRQCRGGFVFGRPFGKQGKNLALCAAEQFHSDAQLRWSLLITREGKRLLNAVQQVLGTNGLSKKSTAPAFIAKATVLVVAWALMPITGKAG